VYGSSVATKTAYQPRDNSLSRSSPSPTMNGRGITMMEAVERRERALPGPFDYKAEQTKAQYRESTGAKFGTSAKSQMPAAGWNPTRNKHMSDRPGFTPLYLSKAHAASLAGCFSPGPALYSPGNADSGRMTSDKVGTVIGTAHRFTPSGSAAAVITSLPSTMLRRAGEPFRIAGDDRSSETSEASLPMSPVDWGGLPVGRQPAGRRSIAMRTQVKHSRTVPSSPTLGGVPARRPADNKYRQLHATIPSRSSRVAESPRTEAADAESEEDYEEDEPIDNEDSDGYEIDKFEEEEE